MEDLGGNECSGIRKISWPMTMTGFYADLDSLELCSWIYVLNWVQLSTDHAIPVQIQALTNLGFLANGCYQRELADRYVFDMINAICLLFCLKLLLGIN